MINLALIHTIEGITEQNPRFPILLGALTEIMAVDYPENWESLEEHFGLNLTESTVKQVMLTLIIYNSYFKRLKSETKQLQHICDRLHEPLVSIMKILEDEKGDESYKMKIFTSKILISNISENSIFYLSEIFSQILYSNVTGTDTQQERRLDRGEATADLQLLNIPDSSIEDRKGSSLSYLEIQLKNKALKYFHWVLQKYGNTESLSYDKYHIHDQFVDVYLKPIAEYCYEVIHKGKLKYPSSQINSLYGLKPFLIKSKYNKM